MKTNAVQILSHSILLTWWQSVATAIFQATASLTKTDQDSIRELIKTGSINRTDNGLLASNQQQQIWTVVFLTNNNGCICFSMTCFSQATCSKYLTSLFKILKLISLKRWYNVNENVNARGKKKKTTKNTEIISDRNCDCNMIHS